MSVTIKQVIDAAIKAAEAAPTTVYRPVKVEVEDALRCFYVRDGKPDCIFGHGFVGAGLTVSDVAKIEARLWDSEVAEAGIVRMLKALRKHGLVADAASYEVEQSIAMVQCAQDQGHEWGSNEVLEHLRSISEQLA